MGGGLNPVTDEIQYLLLFREFQLSSGLCGIESAELKGKVQASFWAYLKVLDLVSQPEEYSETKSNLECAK